jgi:predicted transcriptional regulator
MKASRKSIALRLSAAQRGRLDRLAKRSEHTRTALLRQAVDEYLSRQEAKEVPHGRI